MCRVTAQFAVSRGPLGERHLHAVQLARHVFEADRDGARQRLNAVRQREYLVAQLGSFRLVHVGGQRDRLERLAYGQVQLRLAFQDVAELEGVLVSHRRSATGSATEPSSRLPTTSRNAASTGGASLLHTRTSAAP